MFVSLEIPPGCVNVAAKVAKQSNWREAHLVRWDQSTMRPVRGWSAEFSNLYPYGSRIRQMHRWTTNNGQIWTAYLCEKHCYVENNGTFYDITPADGLVGPATNQGGYGDYLYDRMVYGTGTRPGGNRLDRFTPAYTLSNWGEELRAMTSNDGRLLKWAPTTVAPIPVLTAVENAPTGNYTFRVTPERHIMLFGMDGKFDTFGWSDEEDDTDWSFTDIFSRAGFFDIQPKSPITAVRSFYGGILMCTMAAIYLIRHVGLPYVYSYEEVGKVAIPVTAQAIIDIPDGVFWPSVNGFWLFNGTSINPVPCDIWDWIVRNIDWPKTIFEGSTVHVSNQGEVWFFFVSKDKPPYNSMAAIYDYRNRIWTMARVGRTCGFTFANDEVPIMSDGSQSFRHEVGFEYPGAELPWIETFPINSQDGSQWITIKQLLPNVSMSAAAIQFNCVKVMDRADQRVEVYTPLRPVRANGYVDIRETARDIRLRINMVKNDDWGTVGPILVDIVPRGQKMGTGLG
jgi:hypothetical protein